MKKNQGRVFGLIMVVALLVMSACAPESALPTLIPTNTVASVAEVPLSTETPVPLPTFAPEAFPTEIALVPQTIANNPDEQGAVRIVHANSSIDNIDVYINQLNVAGFLGYGQTTQPSDIVAGTYEVSIVPAEGRIDSALLQQSIAIDGAVITLIVLGGTAEAPSLFIGTESLNPLPDDQSRIVFINMSVDTGALSLLKTDNTPLSQLLQTNQASESVTFASNFETLALSLNGQRILEIPLDLRGRNHYTIIASGRLSDAEGLQSIIINSAVPGVASVRLLGATEGLNEYDLYLDERFIGTLNDSIDLGRMDITSGFYEVGIYASGVPRETVAPLLTAPLNANAGDIVTLILIGEANDLRLVTHRQDKTPTSDVEARVVFVNALPTNERIRLVSTDMSGLELAYGRASQAATFSAGLTFFEWEVQASAVDNLSYELEAGREYLYIVRSSATTGLQFYDEFVGVSTESSVVIAPIATLVPAPQIRFVNAVEGIRAELRLDNQAITGSLEYAEGSGYEQISAGSVVLTIVDASVEQLLAREFMDIVEGGRYTAYLHGNAPEYSMTVVDDETIGNYQGSQTRLRLVNLTDIAFTRFGVALGVPTAPITTGANEPVSPGGSGAETEEGSEAVGGFPMMSPNRRSLPVGVTQVFSNVAARDFSVPSLIDIGTGTRNVYIVDNTVEMIAATIYSYAFTEGQQYEVIAYQLPQSSEVKAFILEYPSR